MNRHPDSAERFSKKAVSYNQFRRSYPHQLSTWFRNIEVLEPHAVIVDVGAGTGLSAVAINNAGYSVVAVEPCQKMRTFGQQTVSLHARSPERVRWTGGTAADTLLPGGSVDGIVFGDSLQWVNLSNTLVLEELRRIARPSRIPVFVVKSSFWKDVIGSRLHHFLLNHPSVESPQGRSHDLDSPLCYLIEEKSLETWTVNYLTSYSISDLIGRILSDSHVTEDPEGKERLIEDLRTLLDAIQPRADEIHLTTELCVQWGCLRR